MKNLIAILLCTVFFSSNLFAANQQGKYVEYNQSFGEWLVSCKQEVETKVSDCFIGTPFVDKAGRGAIIFTKYYLAVAHNELNLSTGISFKINDKADIDSYMNTGVSVFFKNDDRKLLTEQMSQGTELLIKIQDQEPTKKPLKGFKEAAEYYNKQTQTK
jgi:hypothetical protein